MKDLEASLPAIAKGKYRHNKTGHFYEVVGMALQTETSEPLVIYRPLSDSTREFYARPYAMFSETVIVNGAKVPRFEKVED